MLQDRRKLCSAQYMELSKKLRNLRQKARMTRKELADRAGTSEATLGRWLSGDAEPTRAQLCALAKLFDVPLEYLVSDEIESPDEAAAHDFGSDFSQAERLIVEAVRMMVGVGSRHLEPSGAPAQFKKWGSKP